MGSDRKGSDVKMAEEENLPTESVFRVKRGLLSSEIEIRGYPCPECGYALVPKVRTSGTIGDRRMVLVCLKCGYEVD